MKDTFYKITYTNNLSVSNDVCSYTNFNEYDINDAIKTFNKLKNNKLMNNVKLFIVTKTEEELLENELPN